MINDTSHALNWMAGSRNTCSASSIDSNQSSDVAGLIARVGASLTEHLASDYAIPGEAAALRELLKGRSGYCPDGSANLASFTKPADVSLPATVDNAPLLVDVLRGTDADHFLCGEGLVERMLRPRSEISASLADLTPFWDPCLRRHRKKPNAFYRDLISRGLILV